MKHPLLQPRAVQAWGSALLLAGAVAAIVGAVLWWDDASLPVAGLLAGAALGLALIGVAWWAWRREYDVPPALAAPSWIAWIAAFFAGTNPDSVPAWAPMIAYGFAASYTLACIPLIAIGVRKRQEIGDDRADEMAARALRWQNGP